MSAIYLLMAHFYDFCANDEFVSLFLCSKWDIDVKNPKSVQRRARILDLYACQDRMMPALCRGRYSDVTQR